MRSDNKPKVNVTIDPETLIWVDKQVESKRFASRSHAFDAALHWYMSYLEKGELPPR
mgnify:FL=1|jgi:Arc/MetJ-type ribon-helix-helix transcriptional regulator